MRRTLISALMLCLARVALAQWNTPPWPSQNWPREGARHTTTTAEAFRERDCADGSFAQAFAWRDNCDNDPDAWWAVWGDYLANNYPYDSLYRSQRDNLVGLKAYLSAICTNYIRVTTNTDLSADLNDDGQFTFYTPSVLLSDAGAPAGYFTNTPYRALFEDNYGWRHMTNIFNLLAVTERPVLWTGSKSCGTEQTINCGTSFSTTNCWTNYTGKAYDEFDTIADPPWWNVWDLCAGASAAVSFCTPSADAGTTQPYALYRLTTDIEAAQYQDIYWAGTNWVQTAYASGNLQSTYTKWSTNVASTPYVDELCAPLGRTVQFYARSAKCLNAHAAGEWFKHSESATTGGCTHAGSLMDAGDGLCASNIGITATAIQCGGLVPSNCAAYPPLVDGPWIDTDRDGLIDTGEITLHVTISDLLVDNPCYAPLSYSRGRETGLCVLGCDGRNWANRLWVNDHVSAGHYDEATPVSNVVQEVLADQQFTVTYTNYYEIVNHTLTTSLNSQVLTEYVATNCQPCATDPGFAFFARATNDALFDVYWTSNVVITSQVVTAEYYSNSCDWAWEGPIITVTNSGTSNCVSFANYQTNSPSQFFAIGECSPCDPLPQQEYVELWRYELKGGETNYNCDHHYYVTSYVNPRISSPYIVQCTNWYVGFAQDVQETAGGQSVSSHDTVTYSNRIDAKAAVWWAIPASGFKYR